MADVVAQSLLGRSESATVKVLSGLLTRPLLKPWSLETSKGVVPKNTQKNDQWALRALTEWITERNKRCSDKCPMDILHTEDAESLAKWLSLFTIELRKKDGSKYPPATIHLILCALQRILCGEPTGIRSIFSTKSTCVLGVFMGQWKLLTRICTKRE